MSSAIDGSVGLAAYLALFAGVGLLFIFVNLLVGRFLRPANPHAEKQEIYECGEPTIGSSFVQFDLRFYVVALMFIVFDVEVSFLFPWATVFGKASHLAAPADTDVETRAGIYREMGFRNDELHVGLSQQESRDGARQLLMLATTEVLVFFSILLIAFAYVWKQGDLDWVRTLVKGDQSRAPPLPSRPNEPAPPVMTA